MRRMTQPNLPTGRLRTAIAGRGEERILDLLSARGITLLTGGENTCLPPPLRRHADMFCHSLGDGSLLLAEGEDRLAHRLEKRGYRTANPSQRLGGVYPLDVPLNTACIGNKLICNRFTTASEILKHAEESGLEILQTRQGYARCSCCIVAENALITADTGIFRVCESHGIDCLLVQPGFVRLEGHDYGFLGGASALIEKNLLLFFGDVTTHPDQKEIHRFCDAHEVAVQSLFRGELTDIGGLVGLEEKEHQT